MIVTPDMPDHWKTRLLVDLLGGDELAPVYLIRLWGHCQNQKKCEFDSLPPAAIKAICRFAGDADQIDAAMIESGFMEREGKSATISGWDEHNASLINSWVNGQKGGRPKKPKSTVKEPTETHGLPKQNPSESDREDREDREDKIEKRPPRPPRGMSGFAEFWAEYPKKVGKGAAEKSWKKINPDSDLTALIIGSLSGHMGSDQWRKDGGQYIPNPSTWLNQRRWEDEIEVADRSGRDRAAEVEALMNQDFDPYGGYK